MSFSKMFVFDMALVLDFDIVSKNRVLLLTHTKSNGWVVKIHQHQLCMNLLTYVFLDF